MGSLLSRYSPNNIFDCTNSSFNNCLQIWRGTSQIIVNKNIIAKENRTSVAVARPAAIVIALIANSGNNQFAATEPDMIKGEKYWSENLEAYLGNALLVIIKRDTIVPGATRKIKINQSILA